MCVHQGTPGSDAPDVYALGLEDRIEVRAEFTVEIANHVRSGEGLFRGVPAKVLGPFGRPGLRGVRRDASHVDLAAADVQKEEHEAILEAAGGENFLREKIAPPERSGVALDELSPG